MNLDALWTVDYATNHGDFGNGLAVLVGGNIYGGDMNYFYQGEYAVEADGVIDGTVKLRLHPGKKAPPCAEEDELTIVFRGKPVDGELEINGVLEHEPLTKIFMHMRRQSAVPVFQDSRVNPDASYRDDAVDSYVSEESPYGSHGYLIGEATERRDMY